MRLNLRDILTTLFKNKNENAPYGLEDPFRKDQDRKYHEYFDNYLELNNETFSLEQLGE